MGVHLGSILHGAYGDYYEQMIGLRYLKHRDPGCRLSVFFGDDLRMAELSVFDLSFADAVYPRAALPDVPVDRFHQYQVADPELRAEVIDPLPADVRARFDLSTVLKPWHDIKRAWRERPGLCDVGLSPDGRGRLPACQAENRIPPGVFAPGRVTVGFLWRYRRPGANVRPWGQRPQDEVIRLRSDLLRRLIAEYDAHVLVCGMNVVTTDANRARTDNKYTDQALDLPPDRVTYLQGLSWGLELETVRNCTACVVMASGFSEALWLKRGGRGAVLVDPPYHYLAKLVYNRMPLFDATSPGGLLYLARQPHTPDRVLERLRREGVLPR